jgi:hypothetical protein
MQRRFQRIRELWRFISEAESAISVFNGVAVAMSTVGAISFAAWGYFAGAPWPAVVLLFVFSGVLILAGVYYSFKIIEFVRKQQADELRERYLDPGNDEGKELIDFLVEGEQAVTDINNALLNSAKITNKLAYRLRYYTLRVNLARTLSRKFSVVNKTANYISFSAAKIAEQARFIGEIIPILRLRYSNAIDRYTINSDQERDMLATFVSTMDSIAKAGPTTIDQMKNFQASLGALSGFSRNLTVACRELDDSVAMMIEKIQEQVSVCSELMAVANEKLKRSEV